MSHPLATLFPEHDLVFDVTPYSAAEPVTVTVRVQPEHVGNPALLRQLGVNTGEVGLKLTCIDPLRLPATIKPGMTAPLTLANTPGVLELKPWVLDDMPVITDILGQEVHGVWRSV